MLHYNQFHLIIYQSRVVASIPFVIGHYITNQANNEPNLAAVMHCTRMAGRAIIRVVGRCNDAKENKNLGEYLEKSKFYSTKK